MIFEESTFANISSKRFKIDAWIVTSLFGRFKRLSNQKVFFNFSTSLISLLFEKL
ncbi:hypothetical protein SAG0079_06480 [Streptococcus agalactiae CCUG 49087]|nr:hypothetical protein SAG0079_06480 [Streptococcus agalactiae CCUG 49087]EPT77955.1 hypothetical protein SAG0084_07005 [Streptococcus agalactiae LMG 15085]EPT79595.1 hypothetical protein SAG0091_01760 [Streptococcus agalactiae LMG 15095]EPT84021.1 hypothetical protein SAG0087_09750 [Streptococcus agalactiae LMG 15091]EPU70905.1 hypothetical protein SAG0310_04535 [Streptococcus agalactiae GB00097]EPU72408.1 hypothetical protein SAG0311_02660 [Streptococcus agalactiae GB00111]EPV09798.1 hypot